jgi:hypothetical protein
MINDAAFARDVDVVAQTIGAEAGEQHHFFYNTFTHSLRSRYDFPAPMGYTCLHVLRARTRSVTGLASALSRATLASPSHHEEVPHPAKVPRMVVEGNPGFPCSLPRCFPLLSCQEQTRKSAAWPLVTFPGPRGNSALASGHRHGAYGPQADVPTRDAVVFP